MTSLHRPKKRVYSPRNRLRRETVRGHSVLELFVSGSSTGSDESFFCTICHRDVSMKTRRSGELTRHFSGDRHWQAEVTYRVHPGLPVFNKLMDPIGLSETPKADFLSRPFKDKLEGFTFPEDLLPSRTRVDSTIPLLTMVTCLTELLALVGHTSSCENCGAAFVRRLDGTTLFTL